MKSGNFQKYDKCIDKKLEKELSGSIWIESEIILFLRFRAISEDCNEDIRENFSTLGGGDDMR